MFRRFINRFKGVQIYPITMPTAPSSVAAPPLPTTNTSLSSSSSSSTTTTAQLLKVKTKQPSIAFKRKPIDADDDLVSLTEQPKGSDEIYKELDVDQPPDNLWEEPTDKSRPDPESQQLILKITQWINETIENDKNKMPTNIKNKVELSSLDYQSPPQIPLQDYLKRLNDFICQGPSDLLMAFYYLNQFRELNPTIPLTPHNAHSLLFMCVTMANQNYADEFYAAEHLARVGGVPLKYALALSSELPKAGAQANTIYLSFDAGSFKYQINGVKGVKEITRDDCNKILGKQETDFIFQALEKSPLNSSLLQNLGYDLRLKRPTTPIEKGHLYIEPGLDPYGLKYTFISPSGEQKTRTITPTDLEDLEEVLNKPFNLANLKPLLPKILKITTQRDHTLNLGEQIKKIVAKRGDANHTFGQMQSEFFDKMQGRFYIEPAAYEKLKEKLLAEPKTELKTSRTRFKILPSKEESQTGAAELQKTSSITSSRRK